MVLAFISFNMPKGLGKPVLALNISYFDQFFPLSFGLVDNHAKKQYFNGQDRSVGTFWEIFTSGMCTGILHRSVLNGTADTAFGKKALTC